MCIKPFLSNLWYIFIPIIVLFLSACFSPWQGDEGTLTLQLGPGNSGRSVVLPEEQSSLSYTITLTGLGQPITETFPAGTTAATFSLRPGTWNVTVKGRGPKPVMETYYHFPDVMLRAYGEKTIAVEGGRNISESIEMFPSVEAENGKQLETAFYWANTYGKKEYVFITENIKLGDGTLSITPTPFTVGSEKNIELRAEKLVTIERDLQNRGNLPLFIISSGGTLTLGKEGETNQYLHISGKINGEDQSPYASKPLVTVEGGGTLIMYDAWISHNRVSAVYYDASGVQVSGSSISGATFEMYGGRIENNSGGNTGGGVSVASGGTFTLYGGDIAGNKADFGGQVYVGAGGPGGAGYFFMKGGILSGKGSTAAYQAKSGAGVCIQGGNFIKTDGIIYGSEPSAGENKLSASVAGGAVYWETYAVRNATLFSDDNISTYDDEENWEFP